MPQTILTLIGELLPDRAADARLLIDNLRTTVETKGRAQGGSHEYEPLITEMPDLHFASIMVFDDERFDPMLTVELNFDGAVDGFLRQLAKSSLMPYMRAVLRCCKRPEGKASHAYDQAVGSGDMVPYLKSLIVRPAVAHQGNRGLVRDRILQEAKLYDDVQVALGSPACRAATDAEELHSALRSAVAVRNAWLDKAPPDRIGLGERVVDWGRLLLLILGLVGLLMVPGFLLALALPAAGNWFAGGALVLGLAGIGYIVSQHEKSPPDPPRAPQLPPKQSRWATTDKAIKGVLIFVAVLVAALLVGAYVYVAVRAGLAVLLLIVVAVALMLRHLENSDLVHEKPRIDPRRLREIMELEDHISQNHMGSVVHVKPGILRAILVRLGLLGLGLLLRVQATNGYLADMRTIHFAHWALLDNGSRLLFFSNFDSSWESYLDDFIEKAHGGLTLAWSNGIGFPRTKFLVTEGATHGPLFKTWARHSMARGLFWVSAYPKLSVNQIERNCGIAAGLCARTLSPQAAETWAALL